MMPVNESKKYGRFNNFLENYPYSIIFLVSFIVYFQTLFFDYVQFDDEYFHFANPVTRQKVSNVKDALTSGYMLSTYYRPIVNLSFVVDAAVGGKNAFIHHFINLILHSLVCCVLFILLTKLETDKVPALLLTIIYAAHPLFPNAVVWIVGRNDLLAALFSILSMIFFIRYYHEERNTWLALNVVFLALAAFSKEMSILLPIVFIAYIFVIRPASVDIKRWILPVLLWAVPAMLYLILKNMFLSGGLEKNIGLGGILITIRTIPETIARFIIPINISILPTLSSFWTIAGLIIMLLASLYIVKNGKQINAGLILFGFFWFLILFSPGMLINGIFIGEGNQNSMGYLDCRAYLPAVGLLIAIYGLIPRSLLSGLFGRALWVPVTILVLFSALTISFSKPYKNPVAFWEEAVRLNPDKAEALRKLAFIYSEKRQSLDTSINLAEKSVKLRPAYALAWLDLGYYYSIKGEKEKSIDMTRKGLSLDPRLTIGYKNLFAVYLDRYQYDSAYYFANEYLKHGGKIEPSLINFLKKYEKKAD